MEVVRSLPVCAQCLENMPGLGRFHCVELMGESCFPVVFRYTAWLSLNPKPSLTLQR